MVVTDKSTERKAAASEYKYYSPCLHACESSCYAITNVIKSVKYGRLPSRTFHLPPYPWIIFRRRHAGSYKRDSRHCDYPGYVPIGCSEGNHRKVFHARRRIQPPNLRCKTWSRFSTKCDWDIPVSCLKPLKSPLLTTLKMVPHHVP